MTLFALLLMAAAIAHGLSRGLRIPLLPLLILGGMSLNALDWVAGLTDPQLVAEGVQSGGAVARVLEFGLVFLVFSSGVELNPSRFTRHGRAVWWVGMLQFFACAASGFGVSLWIGYSPIQASYIAFGLAASSTVVVLRHLRQRQAMFEPFGRMVTGVLLIQDIVMVLVIVILARLGAGVAGISLALVEVMFLGAAAWVAQRFAIPALLERMKPDEESLMLWLVAVLLVFSGISLALGLPAVVGAFAGGFTFSAFPLNGLVRGQLSSFTYFFHAVFFVALGALIGFPTGSHWVQALQLSAVIILVTPFLVAILAEWQGLNARSSIESGLVLAQASEFSLLLGLSGVALGQLEPDAFRVLALTAILTMAMTPVLGREEVARFLLRFHPLRSFKSPTKPPEGHILMLGFGSAGMWTLKPFRNQGDQVLVVDDDPVVCKELIRLGISVLRGDASDDAVLHRAGARQAKLVITSTRRVADALQIIRWTQGVPVLVRVFETDEAQRVHDAGGIPISNSIAAADGLLQWLNANDRLKQKTP